MVTVSNEAPAQKDIMKLIIILAFLAFSSAEDKKQQVFDDLIAAESVELLKEGVDLKSASSEYYVPSTAQWKQKSWDQQNQQNNWNQQNSWNQPQNTWTQPQNTWTQPQNTWTQPQNTWTQPQNTWPQQGVKPIQPVNTYPQVVNDYYPSQPSWSTPHYHSTTTTTTPIPVIKNEQYYGDNGSYKYEYQIADGTHVGEEGYFTDPKGTDESLVKKGWYSYVGADGKTYTVTYWADKTGFHAYGDHLPTPPPVPAAIQAALDKEAQKQQNQNQQYPIYSDTYYTTTSVPYYPNYPNYPANQQYPNNQQTYPQTYPQTQHGYGK